VRPDAIRRATLTRRQRTFANRLMNGCTASAGKVITLSARTNRRQSPRIFPVSKAHLRVSFRLGPGRDPHAANRRAARRATRIRFTIARSDPASFTPIPGFFVKRIQLNLRAKMRMSEN
jgi:hypothetical protein